MGASARRSPQRVLIPLGIGTAISLLGDNTLYTVLPNPDIAAQAGLTLGMVGLMLGVNRLTRVALNGPVGVLFDRVPRRGLLVASLALGALSTATYALTRGLVPFLAGRVMWGAAWSGIWVGGNAVVLDISTDANRGRLSGQYQMWFFIGVALSGMLGGVFTDVLGFRGGLGLSAALTGLAALMWLAFLPETRPAPPYDLPRRADREAAGPFPWRVALAASAPYIAMRFVFAGVLAATSILWLGAFVGDEAALLGLRVPIATLTGFFVAARTLSSVAGAPAAGALSDRLGRRWAVMAGSFGLAAAGLWLMGGRVLAAALAGALLAQVNTGSIQGLATALAGDRVGTERQGRVLGILFTLGDLGSALGPPLALNLLGVLTLSQLYRLCAVLMLAMVVFAIWQAAADGQKASAAT